MFEPRTTEELIAIASAGGGFGIDAGPRSTDELVRIASAAARSRARVVFYHVHARSTEEIIRIASAGEGAVSFEDHI